MGVTKRKIRGLFVKTWNKSGQQKSKTRMTASILKQGPNIQMVQKNAICLDKTQLANFGGNPL